MTEISAGQMQVQQRLVVRVVTGADGLHRVGFVACPQAFLLAGRRILGIEDSAAPEQGVFCFHAHEV